MIVRTYCRRSKNDEGKQQFSLDVQASGCTELIARMGHGEAERRDYIDDGRSGDDFHTRAGLRALLADAQRGDVIVCRDQSRLGRDAIEVTLVVRDLVRDRGCRLFYYATGQEALFANAIDQATTFIQGTGHQMELEAIRSRTREALRSRVREGRIAGGICFGYSLERRSDGTGRKFTVAKIDGSEAAIVRRMFEDSRAGSGFKQLAHRLNAEGVPAPSAGRRGTGSWSAGTIRAILLNPRYRGLYVHGRMKKVRGPGGISHVKADPRDVITVEIPEWRIVDDELWFAVQERFQSRGSAPRVKNAAKYPLTGLGHCKSCGGSIISHQVRAPGGGRERIVTYACSKHRDRGAAVCPVTIYQDMREVHDALIAELQRHVLGESVMESLISKIRAEITAQIPQRENDVAGLEAEIAEARAEQRRLAKAVALSDAIPELVSELHQRSARIQNLEAQLLAAKRTPAELTALVDRVEAAVRADLRSLGTALSDQTDLRQIFQALFPDGLTFVPSRTPDGRRQVWQIEGEAVFRELGEVEGISRFRTNRDPKGT